MSYIKAQCCAIQYVQVQAYQEAMHSIHTQLAHQGAMSTKYMKHTYMPMQVLQHDTINGQSYEESSLPMNWFIFVLVSSPSLPLAKGPVEGLASPKVLEASPRPQEALELEQKNPNHLVGLEERARTCARMEE